MYYRNTDDRGNSALSSSFARLPGAEWHLSNTETGWINGILFLRIGGGHHERSPVVEAVSEHESKKSLMQCDDHRFRMFMFPVTSATHQAI
ncbi:MAG: hypothetical protein C0390_04365 [Syntrophus sp. (in: bacteria)]|nr:hypothetical protein [Syntrophus sp. (in: bacteria)]